MFKALLLNQQEKKTQAEIVELDESNLPPQPITIAVEYSSLNYKDALAITGSGPVVKHFPMVPGIDSVGKVLESADDSVAVGETVILTGWGVGERHWGGLAQKVRAKGDWLVKLPAGMSTLQSMRLGTAGLTAMLCVMALEEGGVKPDQGEVLVSGAAGGVGSIAVALLSRLGYQVVAASGREESEAYLLDLGASGVISRQAMQAPCRALEGQRWQGAIDTVGGAILSRILAETHYGGCVAACGLAMDAGFSSTVMPFILRGVRLQGVDSVYCPLARRQQAWNRLAKLLDDSTLNRVSREIALDEVIDASAQLLAGQVQGRLLVNLNG